MQHVWLASFPKSGNTWIRFLLYQYYFGELTATEQLSREIPDMHAPGQYKAAASAPGRTRLFVKTHQVYSPQRHPGRYIYAVRNPRDIILSMMNFIDMVAPGRTTKRPSDEQFVRLFIQRGHNPLNIEADNGTIESHWHSWLDQQLTPGIVVRYEDLKQDAHRELRRMVESLGETFDEERGRRAVALSTFDRMRALEVKEKTSGTDSTVWPGTQSKLREGRFFMNKGKSGRSLDTYGKGLDAACDAAFKDTLQRFGYARS